jgi:hypothetical protein
MKNFPTMPSLREWKKESSAIFAFRSSDRVLSQIDDLVRLYWQMPDLETEGAFKGQPKQKFGQYVWQTHRGDLFLNRRGQ